MFATTFNLSSKRLELNKSDIISALYNLFEKCEAHFVHRKR